MTIKEAEDQYFLEVEKCREQREQHIKKVILIWNIILSVLIVVGFILMIVGFTAPLETLYGGYKVRASSAILKIYFGMFLLLIGVVFLLMANLMWRKFMKRKPLACLPQMKNLYANYLDCDDMGADEKECYKQKLKEIKNLELTIGTNGTGAEMAVMLFSKSNIPTLHK